MTKGEIVLREEFCKGCGYCEHYCSRGCIELSESVLNPLGYHPAKFTRPDQCNACGVCAWMCPSLCIETYKFRQDVIE